MPGKINIIVKRPGQLPVMEEIDNTLDAMQQIVGGYIETETVPYVGVLIFNRDGRLDDNLRHNVVIRVPGKPYKLDLCGTILFCGAEDDRFVDSPLDVPQFRSVFGVVR